jgi:hypothetical protein
MKIQEVAAFEQGNSTAMLLVREGLFWRAYGRSAQLFCAHIRSFQVKRRTVKGMDAPLVYIGFPHMILADVLAQAQRKGAVLRQEENEIRLEGLDAGDHEAWLASLPSDPPKSPVKKKSDVSSPAFAYRKAYELLLEIFQRSQHFSKTVRYTMGERLRGESLDLLTTVYLAAQGETDEQAPQRAIHAAGVLRLYLRVLNDLHELSFPAYTSLNGTIQELYGQLEVWGAARVPVRHGGGE